MQHIQLNLLLPPEKEQQLQDQNQPIGTRYRVWLFALTGTPVTHAD
jgi:hypothetical protein